MTVKKQKPVYQKINRVFEADCFIEFNDKPRGKAGVGTAYETCYDTEVAKLASRLKKKSPSSASELENLTKLLDDCLQTASSMKNKRATELVRKLRAAKRQVALLPSGDS